MPCSICGEIGHNSRSCRSARECPICFQKLTKKNYSITICGHEFCTTCLVQSCNRNGKCPICRETVCENLILKTFIENKENIIKYSLAEFKITERFPDILENEKFKDKIIEDFVYFSHLMLQNTVEILNS
jgi:hypothetical protein